MREPNFYLFLWLAFIVYMLRAIFRIILGLAKVEKPKEDTFNEYDVIGGLIALIISIIVWLW